MSSHVVLMASQSSVKANMSAFPMGESSERGTTPPRDIKVRRITAVLLCQHTHTLSLSRLPCHLLCQINLDVSQVHNSITISTAWSSERKRALWENFPLVCGLCGFLLLICSSANYGVMNGEGLERLIAQESATFQSAIGWDLFSLRSAILRTVFYVIRLPVLGKNHV